MTALNRAIEQIHVTDAMAQTCIGQAILKLRAENAKTSAGAGPRQARVPPRVADAHSSVIKMALEEMLRLRKLGDAGASAPIKVTDPRSTVFGAAFADALKAGKFGAHAAVAPAERAEVRSTVFGTPIEEWLQLRELTAPVSAVLDAPSVPDPAPIGPPDAPVVAEPAPAASAPPVVTEPPVEASGVEPAKLKIGDIATALGCSARTVQRALAAGRFVADAVPVVIGGLERKRYRWRVSQLAAIRAIFAPPVAPPTPVAPKPKGRPPAKKAKRIAEAERKDVLARLRDGD